MSHSNVGRKNRNVHPFPARMAPDIALDKIEELSEEGSLVLDPMCGSGTVPRVALAANRRAVAADVDPLAVLMTRTACTPGWAVNLAHRARVLSEEARSLDDAMPKWIADDTETDQFTKYWFAERQRIDLARLARVIAPLPRTSDPLRLALSRLIVTKTGGASLARDTSHSRPHRVGLSNDFDVFSGFVESAQQLERIMAEKFFAHNARVRSGDARRLGGVVDSRSVDLIVTSPPYLNAIDYLRGHRLSLVWLGWTTARLRSLRGDSIGAESGVRSSPVLIEAAQRAVPKLAELSTRHQGMVFRFSKDMDRLCRSLSRVAKPKAHLVMVVADSTLKGCSISNSALAASSAERYGFRLIETIHRPLPQKHRYLPPPETGSSALGARMREELILTFSVSK